MADPRLTARLADLREFAELRELFELARDADIATLGRKTFSNPAEHDQLEWEKKKAYYAGVDAVLSFPAKQRDKQRREAAQ